MPTITLMQLQDINCNQVMISQNCIFIFILHKSSSLQGESEFYVFGFQT